MRISDLISMTFRNLSRRKARTLLTMMGVVVGTCAIVVMISLGLAMTQAMEDSLAQMGDLTQINIQNYGNAKDKPKLDDAVLQKISKIDGVVAVSPFSSMPNMNMKIVSGRNDRYEMQPYSLMCVYADALPHFGYQVQEGELLTSTTNLKKSLNIMMGSQMAYDFTDTKKSWRNNRVSPYPDENGVVKPPFIDPMTGEMTLLLQSMEFNDKGEPKYPPVKRQVNVTGIMVENNSLGWETMYGGFVDIRDIKELKKEYDRVNKVRPNKNQEMQDFGGGASLDNYTDVRVKVENIDLVPEVDQKIKDMGYDTFSLDSIREPMQKQMQQQQLFLGSLAAISLLVAAIGITNTMIMSIYERTREIGVMKVLGCKVGNIRTAFLMEAGAIGFCGGVLGVGISLLISFGLNHLAATGMAGGGGGFLPSMMGGMGASAVQLSIIPPWLILSAIAFATVIGLVSGFYPANRAVRISALEAIKHD